MTLLMDCLIVMIFTASAIASLGILSHGAGWIYYDRQIIFYQILPLSWNGFLSRKFYSNKIKEFQKSRVVYFSTLKFFKTWNAEEFLKSLEKFSDIFEDSPWLPKNHWSILNEILKTLRAGRQTTSLYPLQLSDLSIYSFRDNSWFRLI